MINGDELLMRFILFLTVGFVNATMPNFEEVFVPIEEPPSGVRIDVGIHASLSHPGQSLCRRVGEGRRRVILGQLGEVGWPDNLYGLVDFQRVAGTYFVTGEYTHEVFVLLL